MTDLELMNREESNPDTLSALEAILMVVEQPVPTADLAGAVGLGESATLAALRELQEEYAGAGGNRVRGFELRVVDGCWRFYSRPRWAGVVGRFVVGADSAQLSRAALETLAIVAYRQPVTRLQVAQIRGVNVDSVMRTLQARGLIEEEGLSETGAYLYRTAPYFLECMGFETLEELEPLAPFLPAMEEALEFTIEMEE